MDTTSQVTYEEFVSMCGCGAVLGFEGMLAHYRITAAQWTQVSGGWNHIVATNPHYAQHATRVEQEAGRIRSGGAPRPISIGSAAVDPGAAPAAVSADGFPAAQDPSLHAVSGAMPGAMPVAVSYGARPDPAPQQYVAAPAYPLQQGWPQQQQRPPQHPGYAQPSYGYRQPGFNQQANQLGNDVGNAFSAFGNAVGSFVNGTPGALAPGAPVMVQWSDGNRYPATVMLAQSGQVQVQFPDGRQVWIGQGYVSPR